MLSWEYPPRIVGGISRVVEGLSRSLTEQGHEVHVITNEMPGSPLEESDRGVIHASTHHHIRSADAAVEARQP